MPHFMIVYQFIKPFLDKKCLFFEEYGAFKGKNLLMEMFAPILIEGYSLRKEFALRGADSFL